MSTTILNLNTLVINGQDAAGHHGDFVNAITSAKMTETIKGSSSLEVVLRDPSRAILRSGVLSGRATTQLDGVGLELMSVRKSATALTATFEDLSVAALRRHSGLRKAAAGTTTRAQFCALLCREESWIKTAAAPGELSKVQLARGSGSSDATETTWDAITRIMGDIGWRVAARRGVITFAPDSWLISHTASHYTLSESSPSVDNIDLDWNTGKPAATATITVYSGVTELVPGSPVILTGMGPGNGAWLVETIERTWGTQRATVTCVRAQPTLPEPKEDTTGNSGAGGYTAPSSISGSPSAVASSSTIVEDFVQAALAQKGKRYVYGATGPNTFDCSGLVQWAAAKVGVKGFGRTVGDQLRICTKAHYGAGGLMTVQQALVTRGALLIHGPNSHIAISLGNGETMEARNSASGVGVFSASGMGWTTGAVIPGIQVFSPSLHDLRE